MTDHRVNVGKLLNFLWTVPAHRAAYFAIAEGGGETFAAFSQGLVSHTAKYLGEWP